MARGGAFGAWSRRRALGGRRAESGGVGAGCRAATVAALVVGTVMATAASISAGESSPENRTPEWSGEQQRMRQAPEDRRARAVDTAWPAPTAPPFWLWRHLDALPRRLDALDTRLSRIEALIEVRLDQMVEGEKSRNAKDDLWREQESRRVESSFDRLERRMAYMETRLSGAASAERAAAAPRIQEQLRCQQEKLEEGVEGLRRALLEVLPSAVAVAVVDKWKVQSLHPAHSATSPLSHQQQQPLCVWAEDHVANITKEAAGTLKILKERLTAEFGLQADNFVTKVGNMYNDLWQRAHTIESLLKDSLNLGNSTQRDLHEGFRALVQQQQEQLQHLQQHGVQHGVQRERHAAAAVGRRTGAAPLPHPLAPNHGATGRGEWSTGDALELGLGSLELSVDTLSGTVARRLGELGRRLDSSFRMLMLAQNLFLESCHRIQLGEPTLEERLSHVLERLLDTVSNRSQGLDQEAVETKEALHLQTNQILRMLENILNVTVSAIREGDEWLSVEIVEAHQRTKEAISTSAKQTVNDVVTAVNEAIKADVCSVTFSTAQDSSNYTFMNMTENREATGDHSWKDISATDSDSDFEFPHVAAVIKNTGPRSNRSLVALFHQAHREGFDPNAGSKNETGIHQVQQNTTPEEVGTNELAEESDGREEATRGRDDLIRTDSFLKDEELGTTIDPGDRGQQLFEGQLRRSASAEDALIAEDRMEHKRSAENESDSSIVSVDSFKSLENDGISEKERVQAIKAALIDRFTSWDDKNGFTEVNRINSSMEELMLILKFILPHVTNLKPGEDSSINSNDTSQFSFQNMDLIRFAKAMIQIYEEQDFNQNLEYLYTNIPHLCEMLRKQEDQPDSDSKMKFSIDQVLNHTESNIDPSYLKKIRDLSFKLYSKKNKSP